jgi:hypothetical protein
MNEDVRAEFKKQKGFDPIRLFDPSSPYFWKENRKALDEFLRFRTELVRDLHIFFLEEMEGIKREKQKDMEVIITAVDSLLHPEVVEECGLDTRDILGLMERYPFTLQVEDPERSWSNPPSRYLDYYEVYKKHIRDPKRLMFDINCTPARDILSGSLPTRLATGVELATTLFYATFPSGRAGLYSEYTIHPFDADILPYVMESDVEIEGNGNTYRIQAREPFILSLDSQDFLPFINGKRWPFYGTRGVAVPSGTNEVAFKKAGLLDVEALAYKMIFEGDILGLHRRENVYRLEYDSPLPVSLTFSRMLAGLRLDAKPLFLSPDKNGVVLPRGSHSLEIRTESTSSRAVGVVGYFTSSAFYIAGLLAVSLLLGMYLYVRLKK